MKLIAFPWARIVVALAMAGEAYYLACGNDPVSKMIGHGSWWAVGFAIGAVCIPVTFFMRPGTWRALVAAWPIGMQLWRAYATFNELDLPVYAGGVSVRIALAAMMTAAFGWSADSRARAKQHVRS